MTKLSRRTVIKRSATAAAALALPAVLRAHDALSSSGQVNVFAWGDYVQDNIKDAFEKETGITMNLSTFGSNDEAENKLRAAGGKGFDVTWPSVDTGPRYYGDDLLMPIDESKFNVDQVIPSIYRSSIDLGATYRGKRYLIPSDWGTEGMTWNSETYPDLKFGVMSYGDMFKDGMTGQTACRQKSVLTSLAIYLDAIGEVKSNRGYDLYKSEDDAKRVFDACLKFAVAHKKDIGAFWNNATEATAAFTDAGCTIGQTWDTTGILLNRNDSKWRYTMPKEGGLGWIDTMAIPSGAENVDQAYTFINFMLKPETGGMFSNNTGYNSAAVGADAHYSDEMKAGYQMAYPEQAAIDNLWWWPAQPDYLGDLRSQYVEKLTNA